MGMESYKLGKWGENRAEKFLQQEGYQILDRNFRSSQGEIDLVAKDLETLVFVEVKNYSYRSFGQPLNAISQHKKKSLVHAAKFYLLKNNISNAYCRFDVLTFFWQEWGGCVIDHIKNAFGLDGKKLC